MATLEDLKRLEDHLRQEIPDLVIAFKDQSWYHKVIGALIRPFNSQYLTDYTTTIGSTVAFPSKAFYESKPESSMIVLAHESVHIYDSKRNIAFKLAYLFPQVLVLIPLLAFAVLGSAWLPLALVGSYVVGALIFKSHPKVGLAFIGAAVVLFLVMSVLLTKWLTLILLGVLVVGPWPAYWRTKYELRGYGMTLAYCEWRKFVLPPEYLDGIIYNFVGPAYFYMSWNKEYVRRNLEATRQQAGQGALNSLKPYSTVHDFLFYNGLIPRNDA